MTSESSNTSTHFSPEAPIVVVGGGLAGLTAALELAQSGAQVMLFESAGKLGGRAQTREVGEYRFNLGPRALYVSGAARGILNDLGVRFSGRRPDISRGTAWIDGRHEQLPAGPWALITCPWLRIAERFEIMSFIARLPRVDLEKAAGQSFEAWIEQNIRRPRSRQWLQAMTRLSTYVAEFSRLDAAAALRQLQCSFDGLVLYLDGGWQTLVNGLYERLQALGGQVETARRVQQIRVAGSGVEVVTERGSLKASAVVLAVGPETAAGLLPAEATKLERVTGSMVPAHAACLDVALRRLPRPTATFGLGIDTPFYFSVHSAAAKLTPEGGALAHVLRYLHPEETLTRQELRSQLETVLDGMQPGWRDLLIDQQLLPRIRVACHMPSPDRSMATVDAPGLPRVRVAGDWVGEGGLLADASVSSGRQAARSLLAELGLPSVNLAEQRVA